MVYHSPSEILFMKKPARLQPFFIYAALILLGINCNLADDSNEADRIAVKNISSTAPDTTAIAADNEPLVNTQKSNTVPLKNMFGINAYEWNFLENPGSPNDRKHIYEDNMALIKSFSAVRHYLNWNRIESVKGEYTFNPAFSGNWDYDVIYQRCKQDGILVLADLKNSVQWMVDTYPASSRDDDNAPAPFAANLADPASYIAQANWPFSLPPGMVITKALTGRC